MTTVALKLVGSGGMPPPMKFFDSEIASEAVLEPKFALGLKEAD